MPLPKKSKANEKPVTDEGKIVNRFDDPEDETFTSVPIEEQVNEADDDDADVETQESENEEKESKDSDSEKKKSGKKPKRRGRKRKRNSRDEQSVEIDKKNNRLRPFGSSKKTLLRAGHFDPRKDHRRQRSIARAVFLAGIYGIVGFAVYNTFFSDDPLDENEVAEIALLATGYTDFPLDHGEGFARDFVEAYLSIESDDVSEQVLSYYYTGEINEEGAGASTDSGVNRIPSSTFFQEVHYGPTVYEANGVTETSASYTIGAVVEPNVNYDEDVEDLSFVPPEDGSTARWVFFNVNVFYNPADGSMAIAPDSPTMVPSTEVAASVDVPEPGPLGDGETDPAVEESIESLVNGFMEGYAETSPGDTSSIDQYLSSDAPNRAQRGLEGNVEIAEGADAIVYEAYPDEENDEVKVRVNVTWTDTVMATNDEGDETDTGAEITYGSQYVLTLDDQGEGRYLVSDFAPEYYVMNDDDADEILAEMNAQEEESNGE